MVCCFLLLKSDVNWDSWFRLVPMWSLSKTVPKTLFEGFSKGQQNDRGLRVNA